MATNDELNFDAPVMQTCTKCRRPLPVSEFNKHNKTKNGLTNVCRFCFRKKKRGERVTNSKLTGFDSRVLIEELRNRGYVGELTFTKVYKITV